MIESQELTELHPPRFIEQKIAPHKDQKKRVINQPTGKSQLKNYQIKKTSLKIKVNTGSQTKSSRKTI